MAKRRPTTTDLPGLTDSNEDAFSAGVLRLADWARSHVQAVVIGAAVLAIVVVGAVYGLRQRAANLDLAAAEFETVQNVALTSDTDAAVGEIQAYVDRFGGTSYAREAELLLGQVLLEGGRVDEAISLLDGLNSDLSTTTGAHARLLLGAAFEEAERWEEAAALYEDLAARAEFEYQRQDATESLARVHLATGNNVGAVAALESLREQLPEDDPRGIAIEMKIAELQAAQP